MIYIIQHAMDLMLLNHFCMFSIALLIKNVWHAEKPSL